MCVMLSHAAQLFTCCYSHPFCSGQMGKYAIDAATATYAQVQSVGLGSQIGLTPMIGENSWGARE